MGTTCYYPFKHDDKDIYNSGCVLTYDGESHAVEDGAYVGGSFCFSGFDLKANKDWSVECIMQFTGKDMSDDWQTPLVLSEVEAPKDGFSGGSSIIFYQGSSSNGFDGRHGIALADADAKSTKSHTYKIENKQGLVKMYIDGDLTFGFALSGVESYKFLRVGRGGGNKDPEMKISGIRITGIEKPKDAPRKPTTDFSKTSYFPYALNFDDVYDSGISVRYDGARGIVGGHYRGSGIRISGFELHGNTDFTIEFTFQYASGMASNWNSAFVLSEEDIDSLTFYESCRALAFGQSRDHKTGYVNGDAVVIYSQKPGDTTEHTFKIVNRFGKASMYVDGKSALAFKLSGTENYKFMRFGYGGGILNPTFKLKNFRVEGYSKKGVPVPVGPTNCNFTNCDSPIPNNCNCNNCAHGHHVNNGPIDATVLSRIDRNNKIRSDTYNSLAKALEDLNGYGKKVDNCGNCVFQCHVTCQRNCHCESCQSNCRTSNCIHSCESCQRCQS